MPAPVRFNFRAEQYPITIEALHPDTRAVVWTTTIEKPDSTALVAIPPLRRQLGHPVTIRMRFADGTVTETPPSPPPYVS